jgi:hypothetical protein
MLALTLCLGCSRGAAPVTPPAILPPVLHGVAITVLPSTPELARLNLTNSASRAVAVAVDGLAEQQIGAQQNVILAVAMPAGRTWRDAGQVSLQLRYAHEPVSAAIERTLEVPASVSWLEPGWVYVMPLKTDVLVNEDVPLLVLQGVPDAPLDSLELTIDCGGPIADRTEFIHIGKVGSWGNSPGGAWGEAWHTASVSIPNPDEIHPGGRGHVLQNQQLLLEVWPGYSNPGDQEAPFVASLAGETLHTNARFTSPGSFSVSLPNLGTDHYTTNRTYDTPGTRMQWRGFATFPPDVAAMVTVH